MPSDIKINDTFYLDNEKGLQAYEDYMVDIALMLGADTDSVRQQVRQCINLEISLYQVQTFINC